MTVLAFLAAMAAAQPNDLILILGGDAIDGFAVIHTESMAQCHEAGARFDRDGYDGKPVKFYLCHGER